MLKIAMLAAAVALAASAGTTTNPAADPVTSSAAAADTPCHPGQPLELACALRVADAAGDASDAPAELASLAPPVASSFDGSPHRSADDLAFKDAATDAGSVLPAGLDRERDHSHRLAPALLALGALVILLRRRPT
ncbi:MAG TPA: hypothetical protein VIN75_19200 [Burkholderiaceae bacterium]